MWGNACFLYMPVYVHKPFCNALATLPRHSVMNACQTSIHQTLMTHSAYLEMTPRVTSPVILQVVRRSASQGSQMQPGVAE